MVFLVSIIKAKGKIKFIHNSRAILFMFLFLTWVTITTFSYAIYSNKMDMRTVTQFIFTFQYIILVLSLNVNYDHLKNWIYRFSVLMSFLIIGVALYEMIRMNRYSLSILFRNDLAYQLFPGWPNSIPIPLLFSLLISLKNKKPLVFSISIMLGLILTTSRGAYLGVLLILVYYFYSNVKNKRKFILISIGFVLISTTFVSSWLASHPYEASKLFRSSDRVDIFITSMEYINLNPVVGYGGNTIEQLGHIKINYKTKLIIPHTHNWVLETILRYGIVGFVLFSAMLIAIYRSIKDKDCRFLFFLYVFLALFQTFMRDFVFIFMLTIMSSNRIRILNKQSED